MPARNTTTPVTRRAQAESDALVATVELPARVVELTAAVDRLAHILCLAAGIDPTSVGLPTSITTGPGATLTN